MDDFENKKLDGEAEEATAERITEDSAPADIMNDPEALAKELEEIREMFQEAIDSAGQGEDSVSDTSDEADESGELIQELVEITDEDEDYFDEEDLPVCECCGENPVNASYGEDYPYCSECRELMKHYPIRTGSILTVIAMIIVFGLTIFFGMSSFEDALVILDVRTNMAGNNMTSAVQTLYAYTSSEETKSTKADELLVECFIRTGYINDAKSAIEKCFTKEELEKSGNKKFKQIVDFVNSFVATREAIQPIVADAFAGKKFDYKKVSAELDSKKGQFIDEEKGIMYSSVLLDYYNYELLRLSDGDLESQLTVLQKIEKADELGLAKWIYESSICEVAGKLGDKALAEKYFKKVKNNNAEDLKAYTSFAQYYRFLETPDADAMIALCEEAAENAYNNDTSYYPTLVIAYLIKGEGAIAFDTMSKYMNSNYYTVTDCNLYALCALYCGNTDTYNNMESTLKSYGYEISDLVKKYKNDKLTIEQVIADMRGDIG